MSISTFCCSSCKFNVFIMAALNLVLQMGGNIKTMLRGKNGNSEWCALTVAKNGPPYFNVLAETKGD